MTSQGAPRRREPRTLLEQLIWERNQTLAEFVEWAEEFARRHNEPGTLSERNLKRLISGNQSDGSHAKRLRPATARLLERIFERPAPRLLAPSQTHSIEIEPELELHISTSQLIDAPMISALHIKLNYIRRLDRQIGATATYRELQREYEKLTDLLSRSLMPSVRESLSTLIFEIESLAGWQALDLGLITRSWHHYANARAAASQANRRPLEAQAMANQALLLTYLGNPGEAAELINTAIAYASPRIDRKSTSWLHAALGEAYAAAGRELQSKLAFDRASAALESKPDVDENGPYIELDEIHLDRWRGHAQSKLGNDDAIPLLLSVLERHDSTFMRAKATATLDLASALAKNNQLSSAIGYISLGAKIAQAIGSRRQLQRASNLEKVCRNIINRSRSDVDSCTPVTITPPVTTPSHE